MKRYRVTSIILALVCAGAILTGCVGPIGRAKQKNWVKQMNDEFTDDHFEYEGPQHGEYGDDAYAADMESDEYPDNRVVVVEADGEILTNYNLIRYKDDVDEYFHDYFENWFEDECDSFDAAYHGRYHGGYTPIEDISSKKFIKNYIDFEDITVCIYDKDGNYPSEDDMADILVDIAKDIDDKCCITVYCAEKEINWEKAKYDCYYRLYVKEKGTIEYINVSYKDSSKKMEYLVKDMDI